MLMWVVPFVLVSAGVALWAGRPWVTAGMLVAAYLTLVVQNRPEPVHDAGCLRCGGALAEGATVCPGCGWFIT